MFELTPEIIKKFLIKKLENPDPVLHTQEISKNWHKTIRRLIDQRSHVWSVLYEAYGEDESDPEFMDWDEYLRTIESKLIKLYKSLSPSINYIALKKEGWRDGDELWHWGACYGSYEDGYTEFCPLDSKFVHNSTEGLAIVRNNTVIWFSKERNTHYDWPITLYLDENQIWLKAVLEHIDSIDTICQDLNKYIDTPNSIPQQITPDMLAHTIRSIYRFRPKWVSK